MNFLAPKKQRAQATLKRGRRESRVPAAPAAPCASVESTRVRHHRFTGTPGLPCAMVLTAYGALSPATNSSCHRHRRIGHGEARSGPQRLRRLDTSNGCQDHTVLPSAASAVRPRALIAHRLLRTRPAIMSRARRCRVHRIPSRVRDDRETPLVGDGTAGLVEVFPSSWEQENFCKWGWTAQISRPGTVCGAAKSPSTC
jgi:hypothetical protein